MAKKAAPVIDYPTTEVGMLTAAIAEAKERGEHELAAHLKASLARFGGKASEIAESAALPQGDGSSNGARKPAYSNLISEAQLALIIKLTLERVGTNLELPERAEMLKATKAMTKKQASATIDMLFKLPRFADVQAQMRAEGREPIAADRATTAPVEVEEPTVLPGRYVVKGRMIRVSQGKKGSAWFGKTFVRDTDEDRLLRDAERLEVLAYIAANPAECAREYTQLTGRCTCCTRELTNAQSIEDAMGPICSGKFGRAYGVTILGETFVEKPKRAKKAAAPVVEATPVVEVEETAPAAPQETPAKASRSIAKGSGVAKAEKVLEAVLATGGAAKLDTYAGVTRVHGMVDGKQLLVTWDGASFRYGEESTLGGKKFRNVSELLRLIA